MVIDAHGMLILSASKSDNVSRIQMNKEVGHCY